MVAKLKRLSADFYSGHVFNRGGNDDSDQIQHWLDKGTSVIATSDLYIRKPLRPTVDGQVIDLGSYTLYTDLSAGGIDNDVYADRYSYTTGGGKKYAIGIRVGALNGFTLRNGAIAAKAWTDCRYVKPIYLDGTADATIDNIEVYGFSRTKGLIGGRDCARPRVTNCYLHDCYTLSAFESDGVTATNGTRIQITGIEFDDDCVTGSHDGLIANNRIDGLTNSAAILTAVGNVQSDGIALMGTDNKTRRFLVTGNEIRNVAEAFDCFGWHNVFASNLIQSCFGVGVKIFHGASYNLITGNIIDEVGLAGLYTGGSNASSNNAKGNTFRDNKVSNVNRAIDWVGADGANFFTTSAGSTFWSDVYAGGAGTITAGIRIDVLSGGTSQCEGALFEGNHLDLGGNADRGVFHEGSAGGFESTIRPHVITGVVSGGRDYQDSTGYLRFEGFPWQTIQQKTVKTLTNDTAAHPIFDGDGAGGYDGELTVTNGEFLDFEMQAIVTGLSGSSKDVSFSIGGTATYTTIALKAHGGLSATTHNLTPITVATATVVTNTATGTTMTLAITGKIHVNAGGTIIPQLTQNTASAAASLLRGSYCRIRRSQSQHISGGWA